MVSVTFLKVCCQSDESFSCRRNALQYVLPRIQVITCKYMYIHYDSQKGFITQYQTKTKVQFNFLSLLVLTTRIEKCTASYNSIGCGHTWDLTLVKGFNRGKKDVKKLYYSKTHQLT